MPITLSDFEDAMIWTNDPMSEAEVWLSKNSGKTYIISEFIDDDEQELPDDLYDSDEYIILPNKRDLDLGSHLAFRFAKDCMPEKYDQVRDIFRSKGAYRRYRDFLESTDRIQDWYDYENKATREAIIEWCEFEGVELDLKRS